MSINSVDVVLERMFESVAEKFRDKKLNKTLTPERARAYARQMLEAVEPDLDDINLDDHVEITIEGNTIHFGALTDYGRFILSRGYEPLTEPKTITFTGTIELDDSDEN